MANAPTNCTQCSSVRVRTRELQLCIRKAILKDARIATSYLELDTGVSLPIRRFTAACRNELLFLLLSAVSSPSQ